MESSSSSYLPSLPTWCKRTELLWPKCGLGRSNRRRAAILAGLNYEPCAALSRAFLCIVLRVLVDVYVVVVVGYCT